VGYFTTGASWQAGYTIVLDAGTAHVSGLAVVPSHTLRADSAEIQLLAGSVGRAQLPPQPRPMMAKAGLAESAGYMADAPAGEQRVGEFHVYTLPGRWTLLPGVTSSIALFEPATVAYERSYVVRGEIPFWGFVPQRPDEQIVPVEVSYRLARAPRTDFGDRPIPAGTARLYAPDRAGRLQLVGEAAVPHTAAGQDLRLSAGEAFDLTAKRVQTGYTTRRDSVRTGWRTSAVADYAVTISNATDSTATVDVLEERGGEWSVVSSSVPPEKLSSSQTRFRVRVPAHGESRLTYRVQVTW
jgi:hypothetical protein